MHSKIVSLKREAKEKGYISLDEADFSTCKLPENLELVTYSSEDGVRVKDPFKVKLFLAKSPKLLQLSKENF